MIIRWDFQRVLLTLFTILGVTAPALSQTLAEKTGEFLTTGEVTGILLTLGIVFWTLSVLTLGTGVAEVLCFVTFALLFGGRYLVEQDIWIPIGLFAAGVFFAMVEVFVIPGLGVFGVLSLLSFGGLSVLLMNSLQTGLMVFSLSFLLSVFIGLVAMKFLPQFFITRKMFVLNAPESKQKVPLLTREPRVKVGDRGEAASTLRPIGSALFGSERVEVVSEGEFLKKGQAVEVVRVDAQKVVVRAC